MSDSGILIRLIMEKKPPIKKHPKKRFKLLSTLITETTKIKSKIKKTG